MNRPTPPPEARTVAPDGPVRDQLAALKAQQERLFAQLAHGQHHFRQLARSVWRVQEEERRRLARELHDGLGQNLTVLKNQLDAFAADRSVPPELRTRIADAGALCAETLEDTRALSRMLRPQILDDLGLEAALGWLARSVGESAALSVEVEAGGLGEALDGDHATLVFRVVQEALNNTARHARASHALVKVGTRERELHVLVADDGEGCNVESAFARGARGESSGLGGMRERVALFGGRLSFVSEPGEGTQLRVVLPLAEQRPAAG
ncbi:MAG TPA: sensor histidine kinase [Xanthomonadales bacterium]|nr:sensor histidine kinase [Xanthomonadales bacterium]